MKEIKRFQSFPNWWEFSESTNNRMSVNGRLDKGYKQIGNAFPVLLVYAIAKPIAEWALKQMEEEQKKLEVMKY